MNANDTLSLFAYLVLIFVFIISIEIIGYRLYSNKSRSVKDKRLSDLMQLLMEQVWKHQELNIKELPAHLMDIPNLIEVIEKLDHTISDSSWMNIKARFLNEILLPWAKKSVHSKNWKKRCYAVRILNLGIGDVREEIVREMLSDKTYFIRILAAKCVKYFNTEKFVHAILKTMLSEHPTSYYPYIAALTNADYRVVEHVKEIYQKSKSDKEKVICLNILSKKSSINIVPELARENTSNHPTLKKAVVDFMGWQPCLESIDHVTTHLQDREEPVRRASMSALLRLIPFIEPNPTLIHTLEKALSDDSEQIRNEAARALLKLGNPGLKVLHAQDPDINPEAYEVTRHVLTR